MHHILVTDLRVDHWVFLLYRLYWCIIVPVLLATEVDWISSPFIFVLVWQMLDMYLVVPHMGFFVFSQLTRMGSTVALTAIHLINYYQKSEEARNPFLVGFGSSRVQKWVVAHYCLVLVFDIIAAMSFHWNSTMYHAHHIPSSSSHSSSSSSRREYELVPSTIKS